MRALIACLALVATAASADAIYQDRATTVRLSQKPCAGTVAEVLLPMLEEDAKAFKAAAVTFRGREIGACWRVDGGNVVVVDEEGDAGVIPIASFRESSL